MVEYVDKKAFRMNRHRIRVIDTYTGGDYPSGTIDEITNFLRSEECRISRYFGYTASDFKWSFKPVSGYNEDGYDWTCTFTRLETIEEHAQRMRFLPKRTLNRKSVAV